MVSIVRAHPMFFCGIASLLLIVSSLVSIVNGADALSSTEQKMDRIQLRSARRSLAENPRVVVNNDGNDVAHFPKDQELSIDNIIKLRNGHLSGRKVTTIAYSTSHSFGVFCHDTKCGEILSQSRKETCVSAVPFLKKQGTDALRIMVDYCHQNKMECFWSMRMNDTHDVSWRPGNGYIGYSKIKEEHPEWLVGHYDQKKKRGRWSSVNYDIKEIREALLRFITEVCQNYDIDGIELDFCRHLTFFKSVHDGGKARPEEIAKMTAMMRQLRAMTEEEGCRRGRPILIMARVPDGADYALNLGLDLISWMKEDLVDIYVGSDYFRLAPWEDWAKLGKKYNAIMYAGISESRVDRKKETRFHRRSTSSFVGRIASAWQADLQGIYFFNPDFQNARHFDYCGSLDQLQEKNKIYFVTTQLSGATPQYYLAGGEKFQKLPLLAPGRPMKLQYGKKTTVPIELGPTSNSETMRYTAHCRLADLKNKSALSVYLNGKELSNPVENADWLDFDLDKNDLRAGINTISFLSNSSRLAIVDFVITCTEPKTKKANQKK